MNDLPSEGPRSKIAVVSDTLTTSERRIVMVLLSNYPEAGLQTVAGFAELARVSAPTIIRFLRKIGYPTYSDFQDALRQELVKFKYLPAQLLDSESDVTGSGRSIFLSSIDLLGREIDETTTYLQNMSAPVHVLGGLWSKPAALHLANSLQRLRSNCYFISEADLPPVILGANKRSVFIVFDFRRYSSALFEAMKLLQAKGATIILITDRWVSPIAAVAKVLLPVEIERPPFDSIIGPMAVTEEITERLRESLGKKQNDRIRELYAIYEALNIIPNGSLDDFARADSEMSDNQ